MEHRNYSLADQVFDRLERDILSGVYVRGELTTEQKLCDALGVSRTPVREALRRLEQEHLVEETGKGILIVGISLEDLTDIMEIRLRLEGLATERLAEKITDGQIEELRETLELQEFYCAKKNPDRLKAMDSLFHTKIYEFSGSAAFFYTLAPLHHKVQRYRQAALEDSGRAEQSLAEHWEIFKALEARDPALAAEKMTKHVENVKNNVLKGYETWAMALQKKS